MPLGIKAHVDFQYAIGVLETISQKSEDRAMYDQREKAERDYEWAMEEALEEARQQAMQKGQEEGRAKGREEGLQEGKLVGRIQLLQELLGEQPIADEELEGLPSERCQDLLAQLQGRLRNRSV